MYPITINASISTVPIKSEFMSLTNPGMFWLVTILLAANVGSQSDTSIPSSWSKLQISHNIFCSVPYANFRINVYEHVDNQKTTTQSSKKYFYAPIALLDYKSAVDIYDDITKENEMRFRVDMWNEKVENQVVEYLTDFIGRNVVATQVQVVPLEKVALASTGTSVVYTVTFSWLPFRKSMWFSLRCLFKYDCNQLAVDMRTKPELFDNLKLLYSPDSTTSQIFGTTHFHPIHLIQDSAPTADDWTQLVARNSDLKKQLNEMNVTIEAIKKTLNESRGTREEPRSRDLFDNLRRSSETSTRLADAKSIVGELKNQLAAISQRFDITKANFTKELNENKIAIETIKNQLIETSRRSADYSRNLTEMRTELLKELRGAFQITTPSNPSTTGIPYPYFDCRKKSDGNYANPTSKCSTNFYTCANGKATTLNCSKGTVYRSDKNQCDWTYNVDGCHYTGLLIDYD